MTLPIAFILALVILGLTGLVAPADLFTGFSRAAVITIMALFIITAALERTGATRVLGQLLSRAAGTGEARMVLVIMAAAATLSLVMNTIASAAVLGSWLVGALGGLGPLAVAAGLYWAATLLTQVISAQITPLVLAPVAIAAAQHLGADPRALALWWGVR